MSSTDKTPEPRDLRLLNGGVYFEYVDGKFVGIVLI